MSAPVCSCMRLISNCYEEWHRFPNAVLMEEVTVTVPRYALEHAAYYLALMDGPWSGAYKALAPYLIHPKPDPSTPLN